MESRRGCLDRAGRVPIIPCSLSRGNSSVVEHNLAKVGVASSSLVSRSRIPGGRGSSLGFPSQLRYTTRSAGSSQCASPRGSPLGAVLPLPWCAGQGGSTSSRVPSGGGVAEWSCSGLQSRVRRFDSDPRLQQINLLDESPQSSWLSEVAKQGHLSLDGHQTQAQVVLEFVVRRKGLLPKPSYLTFTSEQEGDRYVAKLEALPDRGVVPDEFRQQSGDLVTIEDAVREYLAAMHVPPSDKRCLAILVDRIGATRLIAITYEWVEVWVTGLKRERNLSPTSERPLSLSRNMRFSAFRY